MIHLKYKCKVNLVKLPWTWIDPCLKLVFENAIAGRNTGYRSFVNCASCSSQLPQTISYQVEYINRQLVPYYAVHTRACTGIKKCPYLRNRPKSTHAYMNFFLSQRPRKSPPAVMSTSREKPCIRQKIKKMGIVTNTVLV